MFSWYKDRNGNVYRSRPRSYNLAGYTQQFTQSAKVLPNVGLRRPRRVEPKVDDESASFIAAAPRLRLITYHRYPLRACTTDPSDRASPRSRTCSPTAPRRAWQRA